jgi:hypothetical protein
MTFTAALLYDWQEADLLPGAYVVLLTTTNEAGVRARRAGMHLRDTLLVVRPGPQTSFAFLLRKPLAEKSTIDQVLATATAALNIAPCRVATTEDLNGGAYAAGGRAQSLTGDQRKGRSLGMFEPERSAGVFKQPIGRWPTNLVLVHGPACQSVGTKKIPGHKGYPNGPGGKSFQYSSDKRGAEVRPNAWAGHADADGLETVTEYVCQADCPVGLMNAESGECAATLTGRADPTAGHANPSLVQKPGLFNVSGAGTVYADSGGAARYYVQVRDEAELLAWFRTLTSTPGGLLFEVDSTP